MSKESAQIKALIRSPKAMMDYQLRGKMPEAIRPSSPLITYLEKFSARERIEKKNVRLSPKLGYHSGAVFSNAQTMLMYLKPSEYLVGSWPAESARIKSFTTTITHELFDACQKHD